MYCTSCGAEEGDVKTTVKTTWRQSHPSSAVTMTTALTTHTCASSKINTPIPITFFPQQCKGIYLTSE